MFHIFTCVCESIREAIIAPSWLPLLCNSLVNKSDSVEAQVFLWTKRSWLDCVYDQVILSSSCLSLDRTSLAASLCAWLLILFNHLLTRYYLLLQLNIFILISIKSSLQPLIKGLDGDQFLLFVGGYLVCRWNWRKWLGGFHRRARRIPNLPSS